ncbi:hypothetical protein [Salinimicrobium sp. WS361]|uniref:hypothetical protein n=1 Tax=Salinimicrobium sp. WS361 TaxID=3425123 RepID=UPI003D6F2D9D
MKRFFISLVILMWAGIVNAQFTELDEARIGFDPLLPEVTVDGANYIFKVEEKYAGEFEKDPVAFLNEHCNIEAFLDLVKNEKNRHYQLEINSTKGKLKAKYCQQGNLLRISYQLKDVLLPLDLQKEVYRQYKGWNMTQNVHIAKGKKGIVSEDYYKIRLEKGSEVQNLKISVNKIEPIEVASM